MRQSNFWTLRASLVCVSIAVLVGAWSHNFVDSFTHESGLAVSMMPALSTEVLSVRGESFPVHRVLQYGGSVLGMVMLVGGYCVWLGGFRRVEACPFWQDERRWGVLFGMTMVTVLISVGLNVRILMTGDLSLFAIRAFGFRFLITWIPLFCVGFVCLALLQSPRRLDHVGG